MVHLSVPAQARRISSRSVARRSYRLPTASSMPAALSTLYFWGSLKQIARSTTAPKMTLEDVISVMRENEKNNRITVRLHTGDPCLYGAIREQMDRLDAESIPYDDTPGVSSFCGAAAALNAEYTLPSVSQTVIITRMEGRTPVPENEKLQSLATHGATMVIFLSIGLVNQVQQALLQGAYTASTPVAVVYKATWPEERIVRCTVGDLAESVHKADITKTALIVVGDFLGTQYDRSKLYDPTFTTEYRKGSKA